MTTEEATTPHEEVRRGGQRVIVVNSQPAARENGPTRQLRSLGPVAAHATDPVSVDTPRRRRGGRGNPLVAILSTAVPLSLVAWFISSLTSENAILTLSSMLGVLWLGGLVMAWRALGPRGREQRRTVWFGRAVGLVAGFFVGVYLLNDTLRPLL